jgi:hypothetical protein
MTPLSGAARSQREIEIEIGGMQPLVGHRALGISQGDVDGLVPLNLRGVLHGNHDGVKRSGDDAAQIHLAMNFVPGLGGLSAALLPYVKQRHDRQRESG